MRLIRRVIRVALRPYVALPLVALLAWGLYLSKPWALWVDDVVQEAAPAGVLFTQPTALPRGGDHLPPPPAVLARGTFISHEHHTTGAVLVLLLTDGSRILRIENLDTSNGPDLHVWITDAPVTQGSKGWRVFDDGKHVELGNLKGNKGSQNYALPASVDLAELTSVSIWCDRFNVSFGASELRPA